MRIFKNIDHDLYFKMEILIIGGIIWVVYVLFKSSSPQIDIPRRNISQSNISSYRHFRPKPRLNVRQIDISNITLSPEQNELLQVMEESNDLIFVTGKAGTGKSVLLRRKIRKTIAN